MANGEPQEARDVHGNLAFFSISTEGRIALEKLLAEQREHLSRVDSNIIDLKYGQATLSSDVKKLAHEVSEAMAIFREALGRLRELGQENIALSTVCADYTNAKIARDANYKMIIAFGKWLGGITAAIGAVFGIYAVIKK